MPSGSIIGYWQLDQSSAYGFLSHPDGLLACAPSGNATEGPWQIYVSLPGLEFGDECIGRLGNCMWEVTDV